MNKGENDEKTRNPPQTADSQTAGTDDGTSKAQSRYFRAVVQERETGQMDVLRWLEKDGLYEVCFIRHDRDRRDADATDADDSDCCDDDGRILPHYHIIIRVPKKCTASTMTKRFGGYVHFQRCSDPFDYAHYLTHEVFRARHKFQYSRDDVRGDMDFYHELLADYDSAFMNDLKVWREYVKDAEGDAPRAFEQALQNGNKRLIKSIMSHSYFYNVYFMTHTRP